MHSVYRRVLENLRKMGKTLFTLKESDGRSFYPLTLDGERRFKSDMCTKTASIKANSRLSKGKMTRKEPHTLIGRMKSSLFMMINEKTRFMGKTKH